MTEPILALPDGFQFEPTSHTANWHRWRGTGRMRLT